jgi:hypothetical protein
MARTSITVQTATAFGGELEDITLTAGDATNDMSFVHPGTQSCFVFIKNGHTASIDVVLKGVATQRTYNRAVDVTVSTTNAKESIVAVPPVGYTQSDGTVHLDMTVDTNLELAVFSITPSP